MTAQGTRAICKSCKHSIIYIRPHWDHLGPLKPRHIAIPDEATLEYKPPKKWELDEIHYRDMAGKLLWKDNIIFKRLWAVGDDLIEDRQQYVVLRVALADNIQHVNIQKVSP